VIRDFLLGSPARALRGAVRDGVFEAPVEYGLLLLGWTLWLLDTLIRIPALAREWSAGPRPRVVPVRVVPLLRSRADPDAASARARAVLTQAGALLDPHGVRLDVQSVNPVPLPDDVPPPECGLRALTGRFFSWASSRAAGAPCLTVYFVEDLGPLAGCAVPGTDWIVAELGTDGTTVVHELGHLADLWRHHPDPDSVMTDRPGGSHDRISPWQAALIRTSRFALPVSPRRLTRGGS
jgi:hypothetical protein